MTIVIDGVRTSVTPFVLLTSNGSGLTRNFHHLTLKFTHAKKRGFIFGLSLFVGNMKRVGNNHL